MHDESWKRALAESRQWTPTEARRAVAACDGSGLTTVEFARRQGAWHPVHYSRLRIGADR